MGSFSVGIAVEEMAIRTEEFLTENRYWYEIIGLTNLSCGTSNYSFNTVKCSRLRGSYLVVDKDKVNNTVLRFSIESSNAEMKNVDFNYKVYPLYVFNENFSLLYAFNGDISRFSFCDDAYLCIDIRKMTFKLDYINTDDRLRLNFIDKYGLMGKLQISSIVDLKLMDCVSDGLYTSDGIVYLDNFNSDTLLLPSNCKYVIFKQVKYNITTVLFSEEFIDCTSLYYLLYNINVIYLPKCASKNTVIDIMHNLLDIKLDKEYDTKTDSLYHKLQDVIYEDESSDYFNEDKAYSVLSSGEHRETVENLLRDIEIIVY